MRRLLAGALAALLLVGCTSSSGQDGNQGAAPSAAAAATTTTRPPARANGQLTPEGLREAVTTAAIRRHLDSLQAAADRNGGNLHGAARMLGIDIATLERKLAEHGLGGRLGLEDVAGER